MGILKYFGLIDSIRAYRFYKKFVGASAPFFVEKNMEDEIEIFLDVDSGEQYDDLDTESPLDFN